jgi:hypothetical protein
VFELQKPVSGSADLERIKKLPRRGVDPARFVEVVTKALRKGKDYDPAFPYQLNPVQAWALYEVSRALGLFGAVGVGHGKTGLDILTPLVLPGCRTVALLVPAALREAVGIEFDRWGRNFRTPNLAGHGKFDPSLPTVYPISYDALSREGAAELLETLKPDLIIADEAHCLRHKTSTRTRRVLRYVAAHPKTYFCAWSGTLTSKSIKDYAHLSALALKNGSPLPLHSGTLEEWSAALDSNPSGVPAPAGALEVFDVGFGVRDGFRRRLVDTPGVVTTQEASVDCSIYFLERKVEVPKVIDDALVKLREEACRPDGEPFREASDVYRCGRELASGFYYKWVFPRGESKEVIDRWLEVRRNWNKEVYRKQQKNEPLMDSYLLCCKAAQRWLSKYQGDAPIWESEWYEEWQKVKGTVQHETEAVWLSDYLVEDCMNTDGIIWYEHETFGAALASRGVVTFGAGVPGSVVESAVGRFAASIRSHGTGRNLQHQHSSNLIANYPSDRSAWEQLIGRTHRQGQEADEVIVQVYRHTPELREGFRRALEDAKYQQQTMGPRKLLSASYTFDLEAV